MFPPRRIKHCRVCGAAADYRVPADDNRERAICTACGEIHYENPINVVGTVPVWGDQVLLCRRNIEPRYGLWTLPAGFMELGETHGRRRAARDRRGGRRAHRTAGPVHGAERGARRPGAPVLPRPHARHRASRPGPETIEAQLFREDEMPWDELAFRTVRETLEHYFADRRRGGFGVHAGDIA